MHMHFHTRDYVLSAFKPFTVQSARRPKHDAIRARIVVRERTHFWCVFTRTHTSLSSAALQGSGSRFGLLLK